MKNILVLDDDIDDINFIRKSFDCENYTIFDAKNLKDFLVLIQNQDADALILDVMLPDGNVLDFLLEIKSYTNVPIIIVSGRSDIIDKILGLESGADDYVTKPFSPHELRARTRASIRRFENLKQSSALAKNSSPDIDLGHWVLDCKQYQVFDRYGVSACLTANEFFLLEALALSPNCVLTRNQLIEKSRGPLCHTSDRSIDIQITRIRKKLGDDAKNPRYIKTVHGLGYSFIYQKQAAA